MLVLESSLRDSLEEFCNRGSAADFAFGGGCIGCVLIGGGGVCDP